MDQDTSDVLSQFDPAGRERRTTIEVASALEISRAGAWRRLNELADQGLLERIVDGDTPGDAWRLTENGRERR